MVSETMFPIFIGAAIKSIAVLAAAWMVAFLMRGRSAAARHLVWIAAAAALLALPFLSASLPQLRIPGTALLSAPAVFQTTVTAGTANDAAGPSAAPLDSQHISTSPARHGPAPLNWRLWVMFLWAVGVVVGFARMIAGGIAIGRIRRNAGLSPDGTLSAGLAQSLGITRHVEVLESRAGSMPMTFGVLRPAVFMPADAVTWAGDRRRVVLLHELAHVSRGDVAAHLFARVSFTLYWWNPLAWIAWREFVKEREHATDDLVLNTGTRASDYAGHLLEVARTMRSTPAWGWAAIAMARHSRAGEARAGRSQLEGRLVAILDTDVNRKTAGRAGAWVAAAIAVAMVAPLAALHAQAPQRQTIPADVDAYIRAANAQKNHEMLELAAKAAEQAQKYDTAQTLLQSAAAIRADVSGDRSVEYATGLLKLGDLEQRRRNSESATDFYTRAANILGPKPQAVPALMYLGTQAIAKKDFALASSYFERAQTADPVHTGVAIMWMAIVKWRSGAGEDAADTLFKSALTLQDPQSTEAADTMQIYARYLGSHGNRDEAAELDARAQAVRKSAAQVGSSVTFRSETKVNEATGKYVDPAAAQGSAAPPTGVFKIGGDVSQPQLLRKVEPEYSELARVAAFSGAVSLSVVIGTDGIPQNIQVKKSLGFGLDEKAIDAVSQWRFKPGMKDGQPVPVSAVIDVNFRLL